MAIKNIHLAKTRDGNPVSLSDISIGFEAYFPIATGGALRHSCAAIEGRQYIFESKDKEWPSKVIVEDGVADFTESDFKALSDALVAFSKWDQTPTDEQRSLVARAKSLGYATTCSYTQASWTDLGINRWTEVQSAPSPAERLRDELEIQLRKVIPTELYYDLLDGMSDLSGDDLRQLIDEYSQK